MFGNKKRKPANASSIIGRQTEVSGDIQFEGRLHINGSVRGNVSAQNDDRAMLTLSDSGSIQGDVRVPYIILDGPVTGSVYAKDHIELASKAKVQGDVHYALIEMAMGAEVNGKLVRISESVPASIKLSGAAIEPA
ncbi:MAG: polymer-forming cytoskeletal protein [Gammaproteobacteria bacterium]|nr:polymer-forming cytoskeletal protein [Gammaproteobacteria bacterium]